MKRIKWDLRRLECFVAVAKELHFGRAAVRIGISQPPLTQHIQALEHQVGTLLFQREKRGVTITNAGQVLLAEAERLLEQVDQLDQVIGGVRSGHRGHLVIHCVPTALHDILPPIAHRFRRRYPDVTMVLKEAHTMDVVQAVADRRADIGLAWEKHAHGPIASQQIRQGTFVAALPEDHLLAGKEMIPLSELAAEPLVLTPRKISPFHYDSVLASFAHIGKPPKIAYEVSTVLSQIGYVASGFGVALLPPFAQRLGVPGVVFRPIGAGMASFSISLLWNQEIQSTASLAFREIANEIYGREAISPH